MARKPKKSLHPLRMTEALEAMNQAAGLFVSKVSTVASLLQQPSINAAQIKGLAEELNKASEEFRKVMWPDEDDD